MAEDALTRLQQLATSIEDQQRAQLETVAVGLMVFAAVALGSAATALAIGDDVSEGDGVPVLCVAAVIVAAIGAVRIASGYGSIEVCSVNGRSSGALSDDGGN